MNKQSEALEQRIIVALRPDNSIGAADLAALIEETKAAVAQAEKEQADPRATRQALDAMVAVNRLGPLLFKLQARYRDVHQQEQMVTWQAEREATWLAKQDAWIAERDALVEELRDVYPEPTRKMADLFVRIAANNKALDELNRTRPDGVQRHQLSVELHARGLDGFSNNTPSLLTSVCLFDWDTGRQICPPPRQSMAVAIAATVPASDRRFSGEWWKDTEDGAARQRAEQQRIADYYARTTKEQEERENLEARESFGARQPKKSV